MTKKDFQDYRYFLNNPNSTLKDFYKFSTEAQDHIIHAKLTVLSSEFDFWLKMAFDNDFSKINVETDNYNFKLNISFPKKYHKFDDEGKCISK